MNKILEKRVLNTNVIEMTVEAPFIAAKARAGQFIMLRVDEQGERIPLTIADYNRDKGTISIIFQVVGRTTILLSQLSVGDSILNIARPLGCPTDFGEPKRAVVVGGGVGCAIAYPQAKALKKMGVKVDMIAGFRSKDIVILEDQMREVSDNLYITTDDGTYGEKGFVTDVLKRLLGNDKYDLVVAIGPVPMMKFVSLTTKTFGVHTIVSLNPIMIDGTGMCGCCRVTVGGETKFSCVDGPDFDGHLVDFDELMSRNRTYADIEEHDRNHVCRLEGKINA